MILRIYLFSLYLIFILSSGLTIFIFFNANPYESPFWLMMIFYLGVFFFWTSFFSLIGFYLKVWATKREIIFAHLLPTLRQSLLISLALTGMLFLLQMRVLNWWLAVLLVIALGLIELFFCSREKNLKKF